MKTNEQALREVDELSQLIKYAVRRHCQANRGMSGNMVIAALADALVAAAYVTETDIERVVALVRDMAKPSPTDDAGAAEPADKTANN